jgi:hypothetical protein
MVLHQLDRHEEAKAELSRLRKLIREVWAAHPVVSAIAREAETLLSEEAGAASPPSQSSEP